MQQQQQKTRQKLEHLLDYELNEGENLLWQGKPGRLQLTGSDIILFLIGLPWTAFMLFVLFNLLSSSYLSLDIGTIIGTTFLILLLTPGLIFFMTPFRSFLRATRTIYGITDQRVLFITQGRQRSIRSYIPTYIGNIERIERRGERGDLNFGIGRELRFTDIPNVRSVEQMLHRLRNPFPRL